MVYILIMLWTTGASNGGVAVVQQEFLSLAKCEAARDVLSKAHDVRGITPMLRAQGCFPK